MNTCYICGRDTEHDDGLCGECRQADDDYQDLLDWVDHDIDEGWPYSDEEV